MEQSLFQKYKDIISAKATELRSFIMERPRLGYTLLAGTGAIVLSAIAFLILILAVYFGAFGSLPDRTELSEIDQFTATEIYSSDGIQLGKYYLKNRTTLKYDEIPVHLIETLIATEDKRFYEHHGIDWKAWFRVLFKTLLLQHDSGGGSTISQQLAKNLYPRKDYRFASIFINKLREIFIARRLERIYNKEEILTLYLNTVPFPQNIYGLEVASQRFFEKDPIDLTIEESATLVGTLKANAWYNPVKHPERSIQRRNLILGLRAVQFGKDTTGLDSLRNIPLNLKYNRESHDEGIATYFRAHLRQEMPEILKEIKAETGVDYNLYTDGLKIFTTVDARMQAIAENSLVDHMKYLQSRFDLHWPGDKPWGQGDFIQNLWEGSEQYQRFAAAGINSKGLDSILHHRQTMIIYTPEGDKTVEWSPADSIVYYNGILHGGFLALDAHSGAVKAWAGGIDHRYFQYDHVTARRQTGSVFKPFVFAAALESGVEPCDYFHNQQMIYPEYEDWEPANADNEYGGLYSMSGALQHSVNVVSVELLYEAGLDRVRQLAIDAGLPVQIPQVPSIALGTAALSLFDLLPAYGIFSNGGTTLAPYFIDSIQDKSGKLIFRHTSHKNTSTTIIDPKTAMIMTHMMETVVDSGTASVLRRGFGLQMDLAGKTGTTQSHADGWFVGYTPRLIIGARVGANLPEVHFRTLELGQGAHTALPVCGKFLQALSRDPELKYWIKGSFLPLPDSLKIALDCPGYLEDDPGFFDDLFIIDEIEALLDIFRKKDTDDDPERVRSRNERYSERIRKKNERTRRRRVRKEKRENIIEQLFGKD